MGREPVVSEGVGLVQLCVRVPGWLKGRVVESAGVCGVSVGDWVGGVLLGAVSGDGGLPVVSSGSVFPSSDVVLRGLLSGEVVVEPCGEPFPCVGRGVDGVVVGGLEFCGVCGLRVG